MGEENDFGMFGWYHILEEEEQERCCPNCGSRRTHYDEKRIIWVCLDCDYEWENEEF